MSARLLRLPDRGRLLVATDLQGNLRDFRAMESVFLAAPEETVLVFTGDLVHGPDEATCRSWPRALGTPYLDESYALLEAFLALQEQYPGHVHCLLGNHEHAHVGGPVTSKFHDDEAAALEASLSPAQRARLREALGRFPLVAVAPCGVVLLHGAPSAAIQGPADIEAAQLDGYHELSFRSFLDVPVVGSLLWSRFASDEEAEHFVRALGGEIAVHGHDIVRAGWVKPGPRQLCVSTSFGLHDPAKAYVELDLAGRYHSTEDLREGRELKRLFPQREAPSCVG